MFLLLITFNSSAAYLEQITNGEESHMKPSWRSHHQYAHCNRETQNNFQGLSLLLLTQCNGGITSSILQW